MPKEKYIVDLIGPCLENEEVQKQLTLGTASMFQLQALPQLLDRIKNLMANGITILLNFWLFTLLIPFTIVKLIGFSKLCTTLQITQEPLKLEALKSVQQVAELVQGNWVVKSEILYPSGEKEKVVKLCGITGIHPDIITKARDYVVGSLQW